jgi:hypothetical protein
MKGLMEEAVKEARRARQELVAAVAAAEADATKKGDREVPPAAASSYFTCIELNDVT